MTEGEYKTCPKCNSKQAKHRRVCNICDYEFYPFVIKNI
jgi:hypothetical protein